MDSLAFEVFSNLNNNMSAVFSLSCPLLLPAHYVAVYFLMDFCSFGRRCVIVCHYCCVLDFLRPFYSVNSTGNEVCSF